MRATNSHVPFGMSTRRKSLPSYKALMQACEPRVVRKQLVLCICTLAMVYTMACARALALNYSLSFSLYTSQLIPSMTTVLLKGKMQHDTFPPATSAPPWLIPVQRSACFSIKSTILSAWKKAGLFPFQPTTVINKMKLFDAPERPVTPPQQTAPYQPYQGPFQKTLATRDRPAH
jgi:hypothetical protein